MRGALMSELATDFHERLILDGSKIAHHLDRVRAWERGERIAPITIDMALNQKCNYRCHFCISGTSRILMADGTTKRMEQIRPGDKIVSTDDTRGSSVSIVVGHWNTSPSKRILQVRTSVGKLHCTEDHPILTDSGWIPAGQLKEGQHVWTAKKRRSNEEENANRQSHDAPRSRCEEKENDGGAARQGLLQQTLQKALERGSPEASCNVEEESTAYQNSHEENESDERSGNSSQGWGLHSGASSGCIEENEADVAGGENCAVYVPWQRMRQGSEQDGAIAISDCSSSSGAIRGGREVLDSGYLEWDCKKPRFHFRKRITEDCTIGSRGVLAQRSPEGERGVFRLHIEGVESIRSVDEMDYWTTETSGNTRADQVVVERNRILSVKQAGYAAVYDLECTPHHNFIADGVVVHNCYMQLQKQERMERITVPIALQFIEDCAEIGVRGVSLVSDGESTLHPAYVPMIQRGAELGISMASGTNAWIFDHEMLADVLPFLTYLRVNFSAGEPRRYAEIMGCKETDFHKVVGNVRMMVEMKQRYGLACTLGLQMVLMPQDADQIIPFAKIGKELGVDYSIIKHCSDDELGTLGVDYEGYERLRDLLTQAEEEFGATVKWSKIDAKGTRTYSRCYGPPFILQLSGSGLVAPCGMLFNERYRQNYHIGNICESRFRDIVKSDRYWEVIDRLRSPAFDAQTMCGTLCLQHKTNEALDRHVKGLEILREPVGAVPAHVNFI